MQREDEEAARLYEEFVESFKADDVPGGKAFVWGGTINPDDQSKAGTEGLCEYVLRSFVAQLVYFHLVNKGVFLFIS